MVKGKVVQLEDEAMLPEDTHVSVIPEQSVADAIWQHPMPLTRRLREAGRVRVLLPPTSDSVDMLRQLRQERASR